MDVIHLSIKNARSIIVLVVVSDDRSQGCTTSVLMTGASFGDVIQVRYPELTKSISHPGWLLNETGLLSLACQ